MLTKILCNTQREGSNGNVERRKTKEKTNAPAPRRMPLMRRIMSRLLSMNWKKRQTEPCFSLLRPPAELDFSASITATVRFSIASSWRLLWVASRDKECRESGGESRLRLETLCWRRQRSLVDSTWNRLWIMNWKRYRNKQGRSSEEKVVHWREISRVRGRREKTLACRLRR